MKVKEGTETKLQSNIIINEIEIHGQVTHHQSTHSLIHFNVSETEKKYVVSVS